MWVGRRGRLWQWRWDWSVFGGWWLGGGLESGGLGPRIPKVGMGKGRDRVCDDDTCELK